MALRGMIQVCCPKGCEPKDAEVWSFVRGDTDEALREGLLGGELNLIVCDDCGEMFYPEAIVVYYDPREEMLAFVFPESYSKERGRWQKKMHEDYEQMREALDTTPTLEPEIFFGVEELGRVIKEEELLEAEVQVAEHLGKELGLGYYRVRRDWARSHHLPRLLPHASLGKAKGYSHPAAKKGVAKLLAANDRLAGFSRWSAELAKTGADIPVESAPAKTSKPKKSKKARE
jgi:hypothetical protein